MSLSSMICPLMNISQLLMFDRLMTTLTYMVPACTTMPCPTHKFIEKFFTYRFVMGVRAEFDSLRARLLHSSDTLNMAQVLFELLAEETRLKSMPSITGVGSHNMLAAAQKPESTSSQLCAHCKKTTNRSENCFAKFPEKLVDFRARRATRGRDTGPSPRGSVVVATSSASAFPSWVLDSRASFHVTSDQSRLASTIPITEGASVQTVDGTLCHVTHKGSLSNPNFIVPDIFFVPELSMDLDLLSVSQITDHNCFVGFDDSSCFVQDRRTGDVIGTGRRRKSSPRLYILNTLCLPSYHTSPAHVIVASGPTASFTQWHHRLGHLCGSRLSTLIKSECLSPTHVESSFHCKGCHLGKQIQLPYFTSDSHSVRPFDLIHSNVWGPTHFVSKGGHRYCHVRPPLRQATAYP
jgi:hypothetical protein